jgi:DNA-binding response OmpR family regulator
VTRVWGPPRIGAAGPPPHPTDWERRPNAVSLCREGKIKVSVRVLVVEDDDDLARLLTIRLRNADFAVERAANGEAGVRLTREFDPEFVLMDWMMPIKSGIEAVDEIRADYSIRQPYIAMLSAKTDPDDIMRAHAAGVDEYITKPVSAEVIIDRVSEIIETRRQLVAQLFDESRELQFA